MEKLIVNMVNNWSRFPSISYIYLVSTSTYFFKTLNIIWPLSLLCYQRVIGYFRVLIAPHNSFVSDRIYSITVPRIIKMFRLFRINIVPIFGIGNQTDHLDDTLNPCLGVLPLRRQLQFREYVSCIGVVVGGRKVFPVVSIVQQTGQDDILPLSLRDIVM